MTDEKAGANIYTASEIEHPRAFQAWHRQDRASARLSGKVERVSPTGYIGNPDVAEALVSETTGPKKRRSYRDPAHIELPAG